jgi:FAD/FMN-containing dehydrogenase
MRRRVSEAAGSYFRQLLGDSSVLSSEIVKYTRDWQDQYGGPGSHVLFPRSTKDVSEILKYCSSEGIPIVPQSGNTSLVAGSVPLSDEVVLSLEKMNKIGGFDVNSGVVTCQPGVILQDLQSYLLRHGFTTPYDLGARGSCMLGGNLSTMAAGIHFVKYGSLRNYVLGLEVVLPSGQILDLMSAIRKDNTGPDLKQLFIGSEGTLGVITQANLLCVKKDKASKLIFLKVKGYDNVLKIHQTARDELKKSLNAIEYLDLASYSIVEAVQKNLRMPYKSSDCAKDQFFMLIEVSGDTEEDLQTLLLDYCTHIDGYAEDILTCQSLAEERNFWEIRERVAESCNKHGNVLKYDFSLDITLNEELLKFARQRLGDQATMITGYAHIGDGNIHMNVVVNPKYDWEKVKFEHEESFIDFIVQHRGSISAEHGIGSAKAHYMTKQKDPTVYHYLKGVKQLFDPKGILNPGKIFE